MKLSDYVINFIAKKKTAYIFEVCGGSITHLLDSLYKRKDIASISMHHEQAVSMAAEAFSRVSGKIGVCMATSGPGATNLITGIGSCFFDSIPCLFITGQVNTYEFKFNKPVRQIGFQETDIVNIVRPIVKDAVLVTEPKKIRYYLEKAYYTALSGRPGPVLLDIPMNVQRAQVNPSKLKGYHYHSENRTLNDSTLNSVVRIMNSSSRPVVLVGGGVRLSKAEGELLKFIKKTELPVVTSLMGVDAISHKDPAFVGMIGTYGNRYANLALSNADFLLVLGTRLDTRQTGTKPETFCRKAKIVYVDIEPEGLSRKIKAEFVVKSDIKEFLTRLNRKMTHYDKKRMKLWKNTIRRYKEKYPSYTLPNGKAIKPNFFMHKLSGFLPDNAVVCTDVGQNQMWSAQSLSVRKSHRFIAVGGMGAMGASLPMAIGASFAKPGSIIVVIAGDGGFQLNIQELQTIYHYHLPIKVVLLNNHCYGMVRQFQEQYFNSRFQSTVVGYSCPDFKEVISAYKIPSNKINRTDQIDNALKKLFNDKHPRFLEVVIKSDYTVDPKLSVNKPIEDQEPALSREELKKNMFIDVLV